MGFGSYRRRVLVVDDSQISLELSAAALEAGGFEVDVVESVFDVARTVDERKPDLIVLDLLMPALGGDRVVDILKRNSVHRCPVLLYSNTTDTELRGRAAACGADGYLRKSSDMGELVRAVHKQLRKEL